MLVATSDTVEPFGYVGSFDCVDHAILLQRLRFAVGLSDVVLDWIESFLSWPHAADRLWWPTVSDAARSVRR